MSNQDTTSHNSEAILSRIVSTVDLVLWSYDVKNRAFTFISDTIEKITGIPPVDIITGRDALFPIDSINVIIDSLVQNRENAGHESITVPVSMSTRDGRQVSAMVVVGGAVDDNNEFSEISGIIVREQVIPGMDNLAHLRSLNLSPPTAVVIVDKTGIILYVNDRVVSLLGYSFSEAVGSNYLDYITKEQREKVGTMQDNLDAAFVNIPSELFLIHKNGALIKITIIATPVKSATGAIDAYILIFTHTDEIESMRRDLYFSEEKYRALLNSTTDSAYLFDLEGTILTLSDSAVSNLKKINPALRDYTRDDFIGTKIFEYLNEDFSKILIERRNQMIKTGKPARDEFSYMGMIFDITIYPIIVRDGVVTGFTGFVKNITEKRKTENELAKVEAKYKNLIDTTFEGFVVMDSSLNIIYVNRKIVTKYGYPEEAFIGKNFLNFFDEEGKKKCEKHIEILRKTGESRLTLNFTGADGTQMTTMVSASVILNEAGEFNGIQAVIADITEMKRMRDELQKKNEVQSLMLLISMSFLELRDSEIEMGVQNGIEVIGVMNNEERVFLFKISDDGKSTSNTHEWCANNIRSVKDMRTELQIDDFPYFTNLLMEKKCAHVPDISSIPDECAYEAKALLSTGAKSILIIPMFFMNNLRGFVGYESCTKMKTWTEDEILILRMVTVLFTNALERKRISGNFLSVIIKRLSDREGEFLNYLAQGYQWPKDKRLLGKKMDVLPGTLDKFMMRIKNKVKSDEIEQIVNALKMRSKS